MCEGDGVVCFGVGLCGICKVGGGIVFVDGVELCMEFVVWFIE